VPQEAGPGEVILSKRDELGLLSNFAATPFEFHGGQAANSVRCQVGRGSRQPQYGENGHRLGHDRRQANALSRQETGEHYRLIEEATRAKVHVKSKMISRLTLTFVSLGP
jgi:hypothetical protein